MELDNHVGLKNTAPNAENSQLCRAEQIIQFSLVNCGIKIKQWLKFSQNASPCWWQSLRRSFRGEFPEPHVGYWPECSYIEHNVMLYTRGRFKRLLSCVSSVNKNLAKGPLWAANVIGQIRSSETSCDLLYNRV